MRPLALTACLALAVAACTSGPGAPAAPDAASPVPAPAAQAMVVETAKQATLDPALRCADRVALPLIRDVVDAKWAPDSRTLAIVRFHLIPNSWTITRVEEQRILSLVDVETGEMRDVNVATFPEFSASGSLLSFWRDESRSKEDEYLRIVRDGKTVGFVESTQPDARWVGEELYHWWVNELRVWKDGQVRTVAKIPIASPIYPAEDTAFSADGTLFTLTRHLLSGATKRFLGVTATGQVTAIEDPEVAHTEWSPRGATLLLRSRDRVTLRAADGTLRTAPLARDTRVHGWTPDGRLLLGKMSPTVPGGDALDVFTVLGEPVQAALPNVMGSRAFSPDGRYFAGVSRTGPGSSRLEVFRCGATPRAEPAARGGAPRMEEDGRRLLRPVAGAVTQYVQGKHYGIDVGAPLGSIVYASDDGIVSSTERHPVGGYRVCVDHGGGLVSCAYHTAHALVEVGDRVARGEPIALVGLTGITTGAHVHWEVRVNDEVVDPLSR